MKHALRTHVSPVLAAIVLVACNDTRVAPSWPGSHLVVLDKSESTLLLLAPNSGRVEDHFATGHAPHEVAVSRDGRYAVVADYGDKEPGHTLTVINLLERRRESTIDLAPHQRPHGITFLDRRSTVLVTSETSHAVLEVDLQSGKVTHVFPTGGDTSHMLALAADKQACFTTNMASGDVSRIDLVGNEPPKTAHVGKQPEAIALARDGTEVWVGLNAENAVVVLDARTLAQKARIENLAHPIRVLASPDGKYVVVSCADSGEIALIDPATRDVHARVAMPKFDATRKDAPPGQLQGSPTPIGIVIDPDSRWAFVSLSMAGRVAVVDLSEARVRGSIEAGTTPDGIAWCFQRDNEPFEGIDRR